MNFTLDGKDTVPGLSRHIPAGTGDRANCISAHEDMIASPVNATLTHHDGDGEGETRAAVSLLLATAVVKLAGWIYPTGRLPVEEMYANIMDGSEFTGGFTWSLICAAAIAALGLFTNSSVMLVASMLISPM